MTHRPLGAHVACRAGAAGESIALIVDPDSLQITHFVVKEKARPHSERFVPINRVAGVTADNVRLDFTLAELAEMQLFVITEHQQAQTPRFGGGSFDTNPVYAPECVEVTREVVPEGELALRKGIRVDATDGKAGILDQLITDEYSGKVTHFVLQEGYFWGRKHVIMPLEVVDHVGQDSHGEAVVHLKLDRKIISSYLDASER